MQVKEILLKETKVNEIIIFEDSGWQIGMTQIDSEDLFMRSLNHKLLDAEAKQYYRDYRSLFTEINTKFRVLVIEI